MKTMILVVATLLAVNSKAASMAPKYCSQDDLATMREIWAEFSAKGIDEKSYQLGMGVVGGDCVDAYSLERSAGRMHKTDAPAPSCGVIFILDAENQKTQSSWVLDTLGKRYVTASGKSLSICSKVSSIGPLPGATAHN